MIGRSAVRCGVVIVLAAASGCGGGEGDTGQTPPPGGSQGGTGGGASDSGGAATAGKSGAAGSSGGAAGSSAGTGGAAGSSAGTGGAAGSSAGMGGAVGSSAGTGGAAGASAGMGGASGAGGGPTAISLPQLVHGAAYVDAKLFAKVPLVILVTGDPPDALKVTFGAMPAIDATADAGRYVADVDTTALGDGDHPFTVSASIAGNEVATASGSLTVAQGSLQFTDFAMVGPAISGHVWRDDANDRLGLTWVDVDAGNNQHRAHLAWLDGAFARLSKADDLLISDPKDSALQAETAIGKDAIGVAYLIPSTLPGDMHWQVKLRVVGLDGTEKIPAIEVTKGQSAFHTLQAGADPGGFSVAWLHITDGVAPVEARWARWDMAANKLVGPVTLDQESPEPAGSTNGKLAFSPLSEMGMACNATTCVVTYTKDVYDALVDLNVPKLRVATIDLATGTLKAAPAIVEGADWDTQMWGQHVIAEDDGTFLLVYTANDTQAAVSPKSPCDETLERDLLFAVRLGADGKAMGSPKAIFDFEGTREYPRVAKHPAGYALFWEDQRSECKSGGHIGMAPNVMSDTFALLDTYVEDPGSRVLPGMYPTLATLGTNFAHGWMDNRHGNGLVMPTPELFLDTYWRE